MKKTDFVYAVCRALYSFGVDENIVSAQSAGINAYLTKLGIGEESEALDDENPAEFAAEIYEILSHKGMVSTPAQALMKSGERAGQMIHQKGISHIGKEDVDDELDNIKIFDSGKEKTIPKGSYNIMPSFEEAEKGKGCDISSDSEYAGKNEYHQNFHSGKDDFGTQLDDGDDCDSEFENSEYKQDSYETHIFSVAKNEKDLQDESDTENYFSQTEDDSDDDIPEPVGNPVWFWILFALCCPFLLVPVIAAITAYSAVYGIMILFTVAYVPIIVITIFCGSAVTLAELIYSIVNISSESKMIGFFEFGICLCVAAITMALSALFYYLGTKIMPTAFKKYRRLFKFCIRKCRRAFKRAKGACSV